MDSNRCARSGRAVETNRLRVAVSARRNVERFAAVTAGACDLQSKQRRISSRASTNWRSIPPAGSINIALATNGTRASASSVYPNSDIHRLEHINDGKHGNSRSWISNERGKGWVELEFAAPTKIDRSRVGTRPRTELQGPPRDGLSY
jgi:hypothetical protein